MTISVGTPESRTHNGDSGTVPNPLNAFTTVAGTNRMLVLFFMGGGRSTFDRANNNIVATIDGNSFDHVAKEGPNGTFYEYGHALVLLEADFPASDGDHNITFTAGSTTSHASVSSEVTCVQLDNVGQTVPAGDQATPKEYASTVTDHANSVTTAAESGGEHAILTAISINQFEGSVNEVTPPSGFTELLAPLEVYTSGHWYAADYVKESAESTVVDSDYTTDTAQVSVLVTLSVAEFEELVSNPPPFFLKRRTARRIVHMR